MTLSLCNSAALLLLSSRTAEQARIGIPTVADSVDSHSNPPAIVVYIVDAFLSSSGARNEGGEEEEGEEVEAGSIWLLGLLRCYTEMLQTLPESMRPALVLQVGGRLHGRQAPARSGRSGAHRSSSLSLPDAS